MIRSWPFLIGMPTCFFWAPYGACHTPNSFTDLEWCLNKFPKRSHSSLVMYSGGGKIFLLYLRLRPAQSKFTIFHKLVSGLSVNPVSISTPTQLRVSPCNFPWTSTDDSHSTGRSILSTKINTDKVMFLPKCRILRI